MIKMLTHLLPASGNDGPKARHVMSGYIHGSKVSLNFGANALEQRCSLLRSVALHFPISNKAVEWVGSSQMP